MFSEKKHSCSIKNGENLHVAFCSAFCLPFTTLYNGSFPFFRYTCSEIQSPPSPPCNNGETPTSRPSMSPSSLLQPSSLPTKSGLSTDQICCFAYENVGQPGNGDWCTLTCPTTVRYHHLIHTTLSLDETMTIIHVIYSLFIYSPSITVGHVHQQH